MLRVFFLFTLTAIAEIAGCYLFYFWLRRDGNGWVLLASLASLILFAWLLTLHPVATGRVYAAYGAVYVVVSVLWLNLVDRSSLSGLEWTGLLLALAGMGLMVSGWTIAHK
ncbi:hypothetical protein TKWG_18510 [Advenella kashmirensis WT001]|uniref:Uncharacterized protein n=1 Tax=Advenella kashmirensis (strain DSM 17095 / LMG 22695 / WT001) TaxID=1036672 RepID=I3UEX2_ADVKW|nr:YnfA family protein [Advenella kashmirensis]AFK63560.1 hypothetical protein TKWG_18510 [Advenella kashmirensis WT001]